MNPILPKLNILQKITIKHRHYILYIYNGIYYVYWNIKFTKNYFSNVIY